MTRSEILEELKKLPPEELLAVVEAALVQVREDLQRMKRPTPERDLKRQMAIAAEALFADYAADRELTAFTDLDAEDFHA
jgi:hypothetical protein